MLSNGLFNIRTADGSPLTHEFEQHTWVRKEMQNLIATPTMSDNIPLDFDHEEYEIAEKPLSRVMLAPIANAQANNINELSQVQMKFPVNCICTVPNGEILKDELGNFWLKLPDQAAVSLRKKNKRTNVVPKPHTSISVPNKRLDLIAHLFPQASKQLDLYLEFQNKETGMGLETVFRYDRLSNECFENQIFPLTDQGKLTELLCQWSNRKCKMFMVLDFGALVSNEKKFEILNDHITFVINCYAKYQGLSEENYPKPTVYDLENNEAKVVWNHNFVTFQAQKDFWKYVKSSLDSCSLSLMQGVLDNKNLFYLDDQVTTLDKKYHINFDIYCQQTIRCPISKQKDFLEFMSLPAVGPDALDVSGCIDSHTLYDINVSDVELENNVISFDKDFMVAYLHGKFPSLNGNRLCVRDRNTMYIAESQNDQDGGDYQCLHEDHSEQLQQNHPNNQHLLFSAMTSFSVDLSGHVEYQCICDDKHKRISMFNLFVLVDNDKEVENNVDLGKFFQREDQQFALSEAVENNAWGMAQLLKKFYRAKVKMVDDKTRYVFNSKTKVWEEDDRNLMMSMIIEDCIAILTPYIHKLSSDMGTFTTKEERQRYEYQLLRAKWKKATRLKDQVTNTGVLPIMRCMLTFLKDSSFLAKRNKHPGMIAAKNGMVNLKDKTIRLIKPDDYLTQKCEWNYYGCKCENGQCLQDVKSVMDPQTKKFLSWDYADCKCSAQAKLYLYDKIIRQIFADDPELYNHYRWSIGYALSGKPNKKMFFICHGPTNNGKSLTSNILLKVFPIYVKVMDKSIVLSRNNQMSRPGASPAPEVLNLAGVRMGIINETSKEHGLNDDQCKRITGMDADVFRLLNSNQMVTMEFTTVPFIYTNFRPKCEITDGALWERLKTIIYPCHFTRNPKYNDERFVDDELKEKLETREMMEIIFNWCVRCAFYYLANPNKTIPAKIVQDIKNYKNENNPVIGYLDNNSKYYPRRQEQVPLEEFYTDLNNWLKKNHVGMHCNKNRLKKILEAQSGREMGLSSDKQYIKGIGRKQPTDNMDTYDAYQTLDPLDEGLKRSLNSTDESESTFTSEGTCLQRPTKRVKI